MLAKKLWSISERFKSSINKANYFQIMSLTCTDVILTWKIEIFKNSNRPPFFHNYTPETPSCKIILIVKLKTYWDFKTFHYVKSVRICSFSGRIFTHSHWIQRDTQYLSIFNPSAGKYDQKNSEYEHFLSSV